MSLQSWKDEFYPVDASESIDSALDATLHSLDKWEGLLEENLAKHELVKSAQYIIGDDRDDMIINDTSCALCRLDDQRSGNCESCILYKLGYKCNGASPFSRWAYTGDATCMIAALKECKAELEKS